MAAVDLFTKIHAKSGVFTKAERKVADFILEHPQKVLYMSITELADACAVGDTSVFRFCRTMEFRGYQEFKMTLAQCVTDEGGAPQLAGRIVREDSIPEVAQKLLATNLAALNETCGLLDPAAVSEAVDLLLAARRVVFFGVGSSLLTAMEASNKFMRICGKTAFTLDSHLQAMTAALLEPQDVAVAISYSGSTRDTVDIAKICRGAGAKVICITRFAKSPLAACADLILLSGANEGPLQSGSLSAKICQLYLLDVLYTEYFKRSFELSRENKARTSAAVTDKLF